MKVGDHFYYADEFNVSWLPTLQAMWGPVGQQVMIPTPGQPTKHYGIGAVNHYTGETEVIFRRRKRRREIAELLQHLLEKHPTGTIYLAWDNAGTHEDDEIEALVRGQLGVWFCSIYLLTAPGSTRLSAYGGNFAGRLLIVNCSRPSKPSCLHRVISLIAAIRTRTSSYPLSGFIHHNFFART